LTIIIGAVAEAESSSPEAHTAGMLCAVVPYSIIYYSSIMSISNKIPFVSLFIQLI
jgi:hypothetical protein